MSRTRNGLILAGIGVAMNVLGRVMPVQASHSLPVATFFAAWMFVSVVLFLFGIFRIIAGALGRNKSKSP